MAGDVHYASVSLLLHGAGTNGSTTITDSSSAAHAATCYGTAAISTTQSKFGGASIRTPGSSCVLFADTNIANFGSADFTVEFWVRPDNLAAGAYINNYGAAESFSSFVIQANGSGVISAVCYSGSSAIGICTSASATIVATTWQHVAYVREGSTFRLFVGGVQKATATSSAAVNSVSTKTRIGAESDTGAYSTVGYFDDVRITKGVARYTAAFTPHAEAHSDWANSVSGIAYDDAGSPCARTVRLYVRSTGALLGSAISDASTGFYSIPSGVDEVQRIVLDDSGGTLYNDIIDRVIPA